MADEEPKKEAEDVKASQSSSPEPGAKSPTPPPANPQEAAAKANGSNPASKLVEDLAQKLRERDELLEETRMELKRLREQREMEYRKPPMFKAGVLKWGRPSRSASEKKS